MVEVHPVPANTLSSPVASSGVSQGILQTPESPVDALEGKFWEDGSESSEDKEERKDRKFLKVSQARKCVRVVPGQAVTQIWLRSGEEVVMKSNDSFRVLLEGNRVYDFVVCVCEKTFLGDVRVTTEKGKVLLFTAEDMDESKSKVMDERFMSKLVVVCERKLVEFRKWGGGVWKTKARCCEVCVNQVRGELPLFVFGDEGKYYVTPVSKGMLQVQKGGVVKWTVNNETNGVKFELKSEAREWLKTACEFLYSTSK